jgi:hypothetical protein
LILNARYFRYFYNYLKEFSTKKKDPQNASLFLVL